MNASLLSLEWMILGGGLVFLLLDLWTPAGKKRSLGYAAAALVAVTLVWSFRVDASTPQLAFNDGYVLDALALFFKRFFLIATIGVLLMSVDFADQFQAGIGEYYSLILFALGGMMLAASANDFTMLFVSIELITVTFYVLTSFLRHKTPSLEAGIKYLILGALSSGVMVYGIALVFGSSGTMKFGELAEKAAGLTHQKVFLIGALFLVAGLAFKISAFPFHVWTPDVYEGSPSPTTAFLAVGSKAAGFVLLLRFLFVAMPHAVVAEWSRVLMVMSGVTILYGNLCAIPQRSLKRLLGYSSISNGGYMLLGVAAMSHEGSTAVLYYLSGYLFTVLAGFLVISIVVRQLGSDDLKAIAGLHRRSPLLATALTLAMVSLAGVPPLAGFFGKFLLLKSVLEQGSSYYWLMAVAVVGVVISISYYLGVVRAIYWSDRPIEPKELILGAPMRIALYACVLGMLYLGLFPNFTLELASRATGVLKF
ncbi:MAG: NADH-quinone oxidoreductase subunit N [Verrucomicrobia bacterium]|nr:NADH-quinone oxidoreductase subunit N [Verrucomicrobiota bacterium]MBI3867940.1 NADH-quinone oxidoreductase subunit N [Verrucomicrobiota bacterium]